MQAEGGLSEPNLTTKRFEVVQLWYMQWKLLITLQWLNKGKMIFYTWVIPVQ